MKEYHESNKVYLDFDQRRIPRLRPIWTVLRLVGIGVLVIRSDRTSRGWHIVIYIDRSLSASQLVALQAVLGSDGRREALNLMRCLAIERGSVPQFWVSRFNILYGGKLK